MGYQGISLPWWNTPGSQQVGEVPIFDDLPSTSLPWLPRFIDVVRRPATIALLVAGMVEPIGPPVDVSWLPTYPDRVYKTERREYQSTAAPFVLVPDINTWLGSWPDQFARTRYVFPDVPFTPQPEPAPPEPPVSITGGGSAAGSGGSYWCDPYDPKNKDDPNACDPFDEIFGVPRSTILENRRFLEDLEDGGNYEESGDIPASRALVPYREPTGELAAYIPPDDPPPGTAAAIEQKPQPTIVYNYDALAELVESLFYGLAAFAGTWYGSKLHPALGLAVGGSFAIYSEKYRKQALVGTGLGAIVYFASLPEKRIDKRRNHHKLPRRSPLTEATGKRKERANTGRKLDRPVYDRPSRSKKLW